MRYLGVFAFVLALVIGATLFAVSGDEETARLIDEAIVTPTPLPTATAVPTATPVPTPTPTPAEPQRVTLVFTGEVLSHGPVISQALANGSSDFEYDYRPMFAQVRPLLEAADLAVCHLETPISGDNSRLTGYPIFNAPKEMPFGLAASGYDSCSTASNHSYDQGSGGVTTTLDQMDAAGLQHTGMARSLEERDAPTLYEVDGIVVGHLSYTYGLNGFVLPSDQPYLVNVTTVGAVLADAAAARAAGADVVILSIQWGNEYQVEPSLIQKQQATALLESDYIDLIVGSHVHVVQPIDIINGKYVFYGLGNFLSNQSAACCPAASQNGIMAFFDVVEEGEEHVIENLSFIPTRVDRSNYTIIPLPQALEDSDIEGGLRDLYETVIVDTAEVLGALGVEIPIWDYSAES